VFNNKKSTTGQGIIVDKVHRCHCERSDRFLFFRLSVHTEIGTLYLLFNFSIDGYTEITGLPELRSP